MIRRAKNLKNPDPVAGRLTLTREILGLTQKEFAELAGLILSRYNLRETGKIPLPLNDAMALCDAHDLTLDWLYRGKVDGLRMSLAVEVAVCSDMLGCAGSLRYRRSSDKGTGEI